MFDYCLYLDDFRKPINSYYSTHDREYIDLKWVSVSSYQKFIAYIEKHGIPSLVSFDHDLTEEHYKHSDNIPYASFTEKTGYDCALWLKDYCAKLNCALPKFKCHSMNKEGKENILRVLNEYVIVFYKK